MAAYFKESGAVDYGHLLPTRLMAVDFRNT